MKTAVVVVRSDGTVKPLTECDECGADLKDFVWEGSTVFCALCGVDLGQDVGVKAK